MVSSTRPRVAASLCAAITLLLFGAVALSAARKSHSCSLIHIPPSYTFIGGGFHMQLAVEYPAAAKDATFTFDLPKSFFIDEAEARQLYRMEVISDVLDRQGTAAVVTQDVTTAYTPLRMTSRYFFDIEAPVFKVNYTTNHVTLAFEQLPETTALDRYLGSKSGANDAETDLTGAYVKARLVIPIHSRYETLDTTTPFSLKSFVLGESAFAHRCLPKIELHGTADVRCGAAKFASDASELSLRDKPQYQACLELPVGLLADLPYVYRALMSLLVAGAAIVILAIR